MSKIFYTDFSLHWDNILLSGYEDGVKFNRRIPVSPSLFIDSGVDTDWHTVDGKPVMKVDFDTVREARNFVQTYRNMGVKLYGLPLYDYVWIHENFKDIQFDRSLIRVLNFDIETDVQSGYGNIQEANKEVVSITMKLMGFKEIFAYGLQDYTPTDPEILKLIEDGYKIHYKKCRDEAEILRFFIATWERMEPDATTGWNCIPVEQSIWTKDGIKKIGDIGTGDQLSDKVKVERVFPRSTKRKFGIKLANGTTVYSSFEHPYYCVECPKEKYTKFNFGKKENSVINEEMKVSDIQKSMESGNSVFMVYEKHVNTLPDADYSDTSLYLAGLLYTDGTLKSKNKFGHGFTLFQSDLSFLETLKEKYGITTKLVGPYKNNYHLYIKSSLIGNTINLIYDGNLKKSLNLYALSKLSKRQFDIFFAGLLDGDGFNYNPGIGFCNYNDNDLEKVSELLLWNGYYNIQYKNTLRLDIDIFNFPVLKDNRWENFSKSSLTREFSEKASLIKYKEVNGKFYVRVDEIFDTEEDVEMIDIETTDHFFSTMGIKTHNCKLYDIPYLMKRITAVLGEDETKRLSPFKIIKKTVVELYNKPNDVYTIVGVPTLDYMDTYKKFSFGNEESYTLNYISEKILSATKLDYSEYGSGATGMARLWRENHNKFIDYNIIDVVRVEQIDAVVKYLDAVFSIAYVAKSTYDDTYATIRTWDVMIHNLLFDRGIVVPFEVSNRKEKIIAGGYVKDPQIDKFDYLMSFDFKSLYPSLCMTFNISPETYMGKFGPIYGSLSVEKILNGDLEEYVQTFVDNNVSITGKGTVFSNESFGFVPELMSMGFNERTKFSKMEDEATKKLQEVKEEIKRRGI